LDAKTKAKLVFKLKEMLQKKDEEKSVATKAENSLDILTNSEKRRNSVNMGLIHEDKEYNQMVSQTKEYNKKLSFRKQSTIVDGGTRKYSYMFAK